MSRRVRIGTCADMGDAALVRSVFSAHDIHVVIGTEHHASVLTGLGGGFVSFDIWVAEEVAEEASELLRDLRERSAQATPEDEDDEHDAAGAEAAQGSLEIAPHDMDLADVAAESVSRAAVAEARSSAGDSVRMRIDRRRRTALVLLLGCCITFGTAHMFTRAWMRGIALAGLEALGFRYLAVGNSLGTLLIVSAVLCDLSGAMWRVRTAPRTALPVARVRAP